MTPPRLLRRRLAALPLAALLAAAAPPARAVTLELASLFAEEDDAGWRLRFELEGSTDVETATLTPPGGSAALLGCITDAERTECEGQSAPFASLAALLDAYPAGQYLLSLNGGARTASLPFAPVAPSGLVTVTDPEDGEADVSPTPTIAWVHDCTNCVALFFDVADEDAPFPVGLELFVVGVPPPSPGSLPYALLESYRGPKPGALPNGRYALTAATAVGEQSVEQLSPGGAAFSYSSGALRGVRTSFTVPEAGPAAAGITAVSALACAAVRSRRRPAGARPPAP